jgi:hypothetical protein
MMSVEQKGDTIYDMKTGHAVAQLGPDGRIQDVGDPGAVAELKALMQRDITIRESQIDPRAETPGEEYDPFPEENMCYFGVVTLRPGDPAYFGAFIRRLPYVSYYEARPV